MTRMEALRRALNLNQPQFAERFGVRQSIVSRWEAGLRKPSAPANALADVMAREIGREDLTAAAFNVSTSEAAPVAACISAV